MRPDPFVFPSRTSENRSRRSVARTETDTAEGDDDIDTDTDDEVIPIQPEPVQPTKLSNVNINALGHVQEYSDATGFRGRELGHHLDSVDCQSAGKPLARKSSPVRCSSSFPPGHRHDGRLSVTVKRYL